MLIAAPTLAHNVIPPPKFTRFVWSKQEGLDGWKQTAILTLVRFSCTWLPEDTKLEKYLGCRAAMPPGGKRGEPVTKRRNLVWSAASSSERTVRKCLTAVLFEVYLQDIYQRLACRLLSANVLSM